MGFDKFKSFIASAIYEDDGTGEPDVRQTSAPVQQQQPAAAAPAQQVINVRVDTASVPDSSGQQYVGKVRESFAQLMLDGITEADCEGPDYRELKDAFESDKMKKNIPDANSRWETAFSMMKMMNKSLTKKYVLDAIDIYVNVIDREKKNALVQIAQKEKQIVGEPGLRQSDAENRIMRDEEEIKKLYEKIAAIENKIKSDRDLIEKAKQEVAAGEAEIAADRADLEATASAIKNALLADKKTLTDVLPDD